MARFEKEVTLDINIDRPEDGALSGAFKQLQVTQSRLDDLNDSFDDFSLDSVKEQIAGASDAAESMHENLEGLSAAKDRAKKANQDLSEANAETQVSAQGEAKSFRELMDAADSTAELKNAVTKANKDLSDQADVSSESLRKEMAEMNNVKHEADELAPLADRVKQKFGDTNDETLDLSDSLSKLRRRTNKSTQSMRAAAEIGEIFEDGLGSLSVNLGAFTVALRNFLTQVPLLLTALGSLGTAAGGAAAGLGGLAGAAGLLAGAGLVAQGKALNEEFSQLESTGEGVQVAFGQIKETIAAAAAPIIENKESLVIFRDTVDALSFVVNAFANEAASTIPSVKAFGDSLATDVAPAFRELVGSFGAAAERLQDDFIFALEAGMSAGARFIDLSSRIADQIGEIPEAVPEEERANFNTLTDLADQFTDTMADLAVVGTRIGSGLIDPIMAFLSTMEAVAEQLANLDAQTVKAIVQLGILVGVMSRIGGRAATVLKVLPNLALGLNSVAVAGSNASGVFGTLKAVISATNAQLGGFLAQSTLLGGLTQLRDALLGVSDRTREVALNTAIADDFFDVMAESADQTAEELRELAIAGQLAANTEEDLNDMDFDVEAALGKDSDFDMSAFDLSGGIDTEDFVGDGSIAKALQGNLNFGSNIEFPEFGEPEQDARRVSNAFETLKTKSRNLGGSLRSIAGTSIQALKSGFTTLFAPISMVIGAVSTATTSIMSMNLSLKSLSATSVLTAVKQKVLAVASLALAAAEFVASSGALALAASLAVATGGVTLLLAAIGGLTVGLIANFDTIKNAASSTFGTLKEILDVIVQTSLVFFIESWNVIKNLFEAVIAALSPLKSTLINIGRTLGIVGEKSGEGAGMMATFKDAASLAQTIMRGFADVLIGVFDAIGAVFAVLSTLAAFIINVYIGAIQFAISVVGGLINMLLDLFGVSQSAGGIFDNLVKGIFGLGRAIVNFMQKIPSTVESAVNSIIGIFNDFIQMANDSIPGVDLETMQEVSFTGETDTTQEEFASGADSAEDFVGGIMAPDANVTENNVDNSTTVENQINADPENKQALERTVKRAIRQANSFERRRQGSQ
jgi:hypothetical protein